MAADIPFEIAIIGGGISGLILAIALQSRADSIPATITLYEQAAKFGEIGAGVAFGPNSIRAMQLCSEKVYQGYEKVATKNQSPEKADVWFDYVDAMHDEGVGKEKWLFNLTNTHGNNAVHRAQFLDELVKLVPKESSKFSKRLESIEEHTERGKIRMKFHDGTEAEADAVIGCDGIKSKVRATIFGENNPCTHPVYTHKYAYRGLIPMEKAAEALGDNLARNAHMHMGKDGHVLTFPVAKGKMMNVVAFWTNSEPWPSDTKLTLPSTHEHVLKDFAHFGPTVHAIIKMLEPNLDCWAIFDLGDHPLPYYTKGRICLLGDSAHATSPHHGAGAGICVEDAAVMAELLASLKGQRVSLKDGIVPAFQAFDRSRRERTQWLVQSSRRTGNLYEWRAEGVGEDLDKISAELRERTVKLWNSEIQDLVDEANVDLARVLKEHASGEQGKL